MLRKIHTNERGVGLIEALVAVALTGIVMLAHARALVLNHQTYNRNHKNALAAQQAVSFLELYSTYTRETLGASLDLSQSNYNYYGIRFNRTVSSAVTAGKSIATVTVTITPAKTGYSGSVSLSETFGYWNQR